MRDVAIFTPTRERKENAERLARSVAATAVLRTDLILAVDDDDPSYDDADLGGAILERGPRTSCIGWTNRLAGKYAGRYRFFASLGDDHDPETPGWDGKLAAAVEAMGGTGIAYGDDCNQHEKVPTAPVISSDIPAVLGWLMYPQVRWGFCDDIWRDMTQGLCLAYLPEVVIRHYHWSFGTAPMDRVYAGMSADLGNWAHDRPVYEAWQRDRMGKDRDTIRGLMGRSG